MKVNFSSSLSSLPSLFPLLFPCYARALYRQVKLSVLCYKASECKSGKNNANKLCWSAKKKLCKFDIFHKPAITSQCPLAGINTGQVWQIRQRAGPGWKRRDPSCLPEILLSWVKYVPAWERAHQDIKCHQHLLTTSHPSSILQASKLRHIWCTFVVNIPNARNSEELIRIPFTGPCHHSKAEWI